MAGDKKHLGLAVRVGAAIRNIRKSRNITLREVAEHPKMNTTVQTVSRLETGTMSLTMEWLEGFAAVLDVPASVFFVEAGELSLDELIAREVNARLADWLRARIEEIENKPQE